MPKVLCIYYENCTDGFGAAWAVRHALRRDNVEFHAAGYDDPPRRSRTETLSSWTSATSGSCSMKSRARRGQSSCSIITRQPLRSYVTAKLRLAALRHLFDWMVIGQIMPTKPAAAVRGPRHIVRRGKTPVLDPAEARQLVDAIDTAPAQFH